MIKEYVYGLQCPDSKNIVYIGLSADPIKRLKSHENSHNKGVYNWNMNLYKKGKAPNLIIIEEICESVTGEDFYEEAKNAELFYIAFFDKISQLFNVVGTPRDIRKKTRGLKSNKKVRHYTASDEHQDLIEARAKHLSLSVGQYFVYLAFKDCKLKTTE